MASIDLLNLNWSIVYQLVIYLLTVLILIRWVIRPIRATLTIRRTRLAVDIGESGLEAQIASKETEYVSLLKDVRTTSAKVRGSIREDAMVEERKLVGHAQTQASSKLASGRQEIEASIQQTRDELNRLVPQQAKELARKILGRDVV